LFFCSWINVIDAFHAEVVALSNAIDVANGDVARLFLKHIV
jgi:hypothetical protein